MTIVLPTARQQRYDDFEAFMASAESRFKALLDHNPAARELDRQYSLRVTPGGRYGGRNRRQMEVFFGARPYDSQEVLNEFFKPTLRFMTERGATLRFMRDDAGRVHLYLYPATSEEGQERTEEDALLLGVVEAASLLKNSVLSRYFRLLVAYMQVTSLDGMPDYGDCLRVRWLRFICRRSVDDREQRSRCSIAVGGIAKWTATVGFSGALLAVIQLGLSLAEPAVKEPSIVQFQAQQQVKLDESIGRLEVIERTLNSIKGRLDEPLLIRVMPLDVQTQQKGRGSLRQAGK